jgi:hypothetical protein
MTPEQFVAKWKLSTLGERQAAQPHFLDLCELLGQPKPGDLGAEDEASYCFEKGATKTGGRRGWADVWRRGRFAWEYKGKGANLEAALAQLQQYALALENPPLLVVCDLERFLVVTNWTNTVSRRISLRIEDLLDPAKREILANVFADPERLKPGLTREQVTAERALSLAGLARDLRARGNEPEPVARSSSTPIRTHQQHTPYHPRQPDQQPHPPSFPQHRHPERQRHDRVQRHRDGDARRACVLEGVAPQVEPERPRREAEEGDRGPGGRAEAGEGREAAAGEGQGA